MEIPYIINLLHLKPRVVHRLPGRLRVHIPALRQVTSDFQNIVDVVVTKFSYPSGIEKVSINYITGNLLIHYNQNTIQESSVLVWLSELSMITGQIWMRLRNCTNGDAKSVGKNLLNYFIEASKEGNILDKNFIIPDYVWN
jgi:hypothetical protein